MLATLLIDTHCHLDAGEFADDRDGVAAAARHAGVGTIVVPSVAASNFTAVRACAECYSHCRIAYGIHPLYIEQALDDDLLRLRDWLRCEESGALRPVAVGEIGLDYYVPGVDVARQERFFIEQLKIARDFDLPVLLHVRRAIDQVLKCLRRVGVRGGIAHAFNGSRQQADQFLALGFKLGFGGAMTYPRATRLRTLAADLPLEALVLETDAPDIPPVWIGRGRNSPAELPRIAEALADLRGIETAEVAAMTTSNAKSVLFLS